MQCIILLCYYFKNMIADELDGREDEIAGMSGWLNLYISNTVLKAIADMGYFSVTCEVDWIAEQMLISSKYVE